ncbi:ATP-binding protein [Leptobacterium sp. I13]|uniref:ATP-binding protein n=1 Tax=Leptobacterium meishanense TaxID=3128904 RepID=UPI0030EBB255
MNTKKIVITGGPSTGKTTVIEALQKKGYICMPEISRQITLDARQQGVDQLFLSDPLLFSQKIIEGRTEQFFKAGTFRQEIVFLDRGLPDALAYMEYANNTYPDAFIKICANHIYDAVFLLPPWKAIYTSDNERYENFEQAVIIHDHLEDTYKRFGYKLIYVPTGTIDLRIQFILDTITSL